MKVRDIISKCRLADTVITFIEKGNFVDEQLMKNLWSKDEPAIMKRTVNCWEIKDDRLVIWIKPLQ